MKNLISTGGRSNPSSQNKRRAVFDAEMLESRRLFTAVSIAATDPNASVVGPDTGTFTVTRQGDTSASLSVGVQLGTPVVSSSRGNGTPGGGAASQPLGTAPFVNFQTVPALATIGYSIETITTPKGSTQPVYTTTSYSEKGLIVTIPAGQASAEITVTPVADDLVSGSLTVVAEIDAHGAGDTASGDVVPTGSAATISIAEAAPTTGTVTGTVTNGGTGETLFLDANGNAKLDTGEVTTTSNADGSYSFTFVPPGKYTVDQVLSASYRQTTPASNAGVAVTVAAGQVSSGNNFNDLFLGGSISGSISDNVGSNYVGETVYVDANNDGVLDNNEIATTVDDTSKYSLNGVPDGTYVIRQIVTGNGYGQTSPAGNAGITVTVTTGAAIAGQNFINSYALGDLYGAISPSPAGDVVYLDANNNGKLDSNELSTTADVGPTGEFVFLDIPIGSYIVRQMLPAGVTQVTPADDAGNQVTVLAGTSVEADFVDKVAVTTGSVSGLVSGGWGGDTLYLDANNNSKLDAGESTATLETDETYSFGNVLPGAYVVRQVVPTGLTQTSPTNNTGVHVTVTAGSVLTNENFTDVLTPPSTTAVSGTVSGGFVGETIYLDANNNSIDDAGELSTTLQTDGTYNFSNVPAGAYVIRQLLPSGYTQTSPGGNYGIHVTVAANSVLHNENFIDVPPAVTAFQNGSFETNTGQYFATGAAGWTLNTNGAALGSAGQPNVCISSYGATDGTYGVLFNTGGSDGIGSISQTFKTVAGQRYSVQFDYGRFGGAQETVSTRVTINDATTGLALIDAGSVTTIDGDTSGAIVTQPTGLATVAIAGAGGTEFGTVGLTFTATSTASTIIFTDTSGYGPDSNDGLLDNVKITPTSPPTSTIVGNVTGGLTGETIYLDANNNAAFDAGELSTTLSAAGTYAFSNVPVGAYIIRQVLAGSIKQVTPSGGYGIHVTVAAGQSLTSENFVDAAAAPMATALASTSTFSDTAVVSADWMDRLLDD